MKKLLLMPQELGFPPGYITPRSYQNVTASFTRRNYLGTQDTWEGLMDGHFILAGSPETVREQLLHILGELGIGIMLLLFQIGSLPHDLTMKSTNLFATKVLPQLREDIRRKYPHLLRSKAAAALLEAQAYKECESLR